MYSTFEGLLCKQQLLRVDIFLATENDIVYAGFSVVAHEPRMLKEPPVTADAR